MQNILINKRELLWNQRRKKQNQTAFRQNRIKFLDGIHPFLQTQLFEGSNIHIANPISLNNLPLDQSNHSFTYNDKLQRQSSLKLKHKNMNQNRYTIQYWLNNSKSDNLLLKQTYFKQFSNTITKMTVLSHETIYKILQIFHNFIIYKPTLQFESNVDCIEKIQKIICSIKLNQNSFQLAIQCLSKFVKDDYIQLLYKNKQFIHILLNYYLLELQDENNIQKIMNFFNRIFSWNDQQLSNQTLNFINIIHNKLSQYSLKILVIALDTLTNLVLTGPDIITHILKSNIIENLSESFNLAPIYIKQKIIIIFYNMMIVANDQQKIEFCQRNTLIIPLVCLENKFSLNFVHLSLKILSKIVKLAYKLQLTYIQFWKEIKAYFQYYNLQNKLCNLMEEYYQDQFIHDQSKTLIQLFQAKFQDQMEEEI